MAAYIIHIRVVNKFSSHPLRRPRASHLCRPAPPVLRRTWREAVSLIHLCKYPGEALRLEVFDQGCKVAWEKPSNKAKRLPGKVQEQENWPSYPH
jgi:hypothetical protein